MLRRLTALIATPRYGSRLSSCLMRDSSFLTAWPTLVLSGVHPPLPLAYRGSLLVLISISACGFSCKKTFVASELSSDVCILADRILTMGQSLPLYM